MTEKPLLQMLNLPEGADAIAVLDAYSQAQRRAVDQQDRVMLLALHEAFTRHNFFAAPRSTGN